jgi:hypothetical protein
MFPPLIASLFSRIAALPAPYLFLWSGLAALCVSLVVLLRTRWGQSRPVQKCAVLSLIVHLLLACLAMTVKVVVGDGGGAGGPPIRVRIVEIDDTLTSPAVATIPVPQLLETNVARVATEVSTAPAQPLAPVNSAAAANNETIPPSTPTVADAQVTSADNNSAAEKPNVAVTIESLPSSAVPEHSSDDRVAMHEPQLVRPHATTEAAVAPATTGQNAERPTAAIAPPAAALVTQPTSERLKGPYSLRTSPHRRQILEGQGGNRQTEAAVAAALNWLASAQSPDGRWDAQQHGAGVERRVLGENRHGAGRDADTGITALALLSFLGAGHTQIAGDYQANVERGLAFLIRSQAADGNLFGGAGLNAQMYCHAIATFALAEAQAMSGDSRLAAAVSKAAGFCLRAQHPTTGGWRYQVGDTGDTSQLGWQIMALASSEHAGFVVPQNSWIGIERFLRSVRRGQFGGLASYQEFSPATTSMTAEALYCRLLLSQKRAGNLDAPAAAEATRQLLANPPNPREINLYYWYYATLALHHHRASDEAAAAAWQTWNGALTDVLLDTQIDSGPDAGSWSPDTNWGGYGGRVYSTALAAMCLEVYYRYAPHTELAQPSIANRPEQWRPAR